MFLPRLQESFTTCVWVAPSLSDTSYLMFATIYLDKAAFLFGGRIDHHSHLKQKKHLLHLYIANIASGTLWLSYNYTTLDSHLWLQGLPQCNLTLLILALLYSSLVFLSFKFHSLLVFHEWNVSFCLLDCIILIT